MYRKLLGGCAAALVDDPTREHVVVSQQHLINYAGLVYPLIVGNRKDEVNCQDSGVRRERCLGVYKEIRGMFKQALQIPKQKTDVRAITQNKRGRFIFINNSNKLYVY